MAGIELFTLSPNLGLGVLSFFKFSLGASLTYAISLRANKKKGIGNLGTYFEDQGVRPECSILSQQPRFG
jgi:hypothetical protein